MFAVFHAARRCLNAAMLCEVIPGLPAAMELIGGAQLGFERLVSSRGPPACRLCGRVMAAADSRAWLRIVPLHRCLSNGGGQSRVPAWHDGCQSVKPIPFKGFCTSAYPVTSKSGFLQKANFV